MKFRSYIKFYQFDGETMEDDRFDIDNADYLTVEDKPDLAREFLMQRFGSAFSAVGACGTYAILHDYSREEGNTVVTVMPIDDRVQQLRCRLYDTNHAIGVIMSKVNFIYDKFIMLNKDYEEVSDIADAALLYVIQPINGDVEPIRQFVRRNTGAGWIGDEPGLYMLDVNNTWRLVNDEIRDTRRILECLQGLWSDVYNVLPGLLKQRGQVMPNDEK